MEPEDPTSPDGPSPLDDTPAAGPPKPAPETEWQAIARGARATFWMFLFVYALVFGVLWRWAPDYYRRHPFYDSYAFLQSNALLALIAAGCCAVAGFFMGYYGMYTGDLGIEDVLRASSDD